MYYWLVFWGGIAFHLWNEVNTSCTLMNEFYKIAASKKQSFHICPLPYKWTYTRMTAFYLIIITILFLYLISTAILFLSYRTPDFYLTVYLLVFFKSSVKTYHRITEFYKIPGGNYTLIPLITIKNNKSDTLFIKNLPILICHITSW